MKRYFYSQVLVLLLCSLQFVDAAAPNENSLPPAKPVATWLFDGKDAFGSWHDTVAGPRPPLHPLFHATNLAADFVSEKPLIIPGNEAPSFKHGEALTFDFWISPGDLKEKQPVFLLAKGDPDRAGQVDDNLNFALTVERVSSSLMRVGVCFAAEPEKDDDIPVRHQWWSGSINLTGLDWHHIAIPYTFGDPTSVMLFVNGRMQLFSGKWEKSTERGPVQRPGDLRIGGVSGEAKAFYRGRIDSLILHRGVLKNEEIEERYAIVPPPTPVTREDVKAGEVRVELCTSGVPGRREWPDTLPTSSEILTEEAFGFFELPKKYESGGVLGNPPGNTFLRASGLVTLPKGKHRLLLRARGISRLIVDGKTVLDTPLMPSSLNGHHLTTEQDTYLNLGPDFRFAPPGNREEWCEFESTGEKPHLVVLETIFGTVRPGLGETVAAWSREGEATWQLLSPTDRHVPYTDEGWAAYEKERRANLERINTEQRLAMRAAQDPYWEKRREAVETWLAATPEIEVPALPENMPAHNAIDHFIGARIAEVAAAYENGHSEGPQYFDDIEPLLESRCYDCHQGGKSQGDLRLDTLAGAQQGGESELPAVVPGAPDKSELIYRISTDDEGEIMPPEGDRMKPEEVALLKKWIEQGANWPEFDVTTLELPPLTDELTFLRRVTLDTVGVPPSEAEILEFLGDTSKDRRLKAIDRLLADSRWADHWMGYWLDVLAENPVIISGSLNNTGAFRWWIYDALRDDLPMDAFVTQLIRMRGSSDKGGPAGFAVAGQNDAPMAEKGAIIASAFLGVEMKCARCHDAPAHVSKQEELFQLAAMLTREPVKVPATSSVSTEMLSAGGRTPLIQVTLKPGTEVQPVWPFDQFCSEEASQELAENPKDSRDQLAALVTAPQNERFAQVMANRIWQRLMGRGLVENPADWEKSESTHPELLSWLGREFVRSGYSLKEVSRLILASHAYQRGSLPDLLQTEALYVGPAPRRMTAEQIVDSLFASTGKPFKVEELTFDADGISGQSSLGKARRAWMLTSTANERDRPSLSLPRVQAVTTVLESFGWRGSRQSPVTLRESDPNVLQPAVLSNGTMSGWTTRLSDDHGTTELAVKNQSLDSLINSLYLRLLTRKPTDSELEFARELLSPGYEERRVTAPPDLSGVKRTRPKYTAWSIHLDGPANALAQELETMARRGDPPTWKLTSEWRERLEDFLWLTLNQPEWLYIR
ncbi:DUF1553 domain-containing protein [Aureliella helgolandensis]|uniref:Planctomycete cytochrome C n=1 Tax=Aureliella helgolandensis TaxID=2527968 RepID=A0A518GA76_9BACT|nr:DUF1553 domain-containing protein [Aureliella helgolandensis]QDV25491.1 Planctomycete cytochrome C [Aureliella helgolandensis]